MKKKCLLAVFTLAATMAAAAQQPTTNSAPRTTSAARPTQTTSGAPAARQTPADQKVYTEAARIKDPRKKIDALEKFIDQHPESPSASSAHLDIIDALIKSRPEGHERNEYILAQADKAIQKASGASASGTVAFNVASRLMRAGLFAEAEQYAQKSVAATDEYVA